MHLKLFSNLLSKLFINFYLYIYIFLNEIRQLAIETNYMCGCFLTDSTSSITKKTYLML